MSHFDATLPAPAAFAAPARSARSAHSARSGAVPLIRLLAGVALASAAVGGAATLALEHLIVSMEPPLLAPAPQPALPSSWPTTDGLPAVNDVLRDRAEPPLEPPPAS